MTSVDVQTLFIEWLNVYLGDVPVIKSHEGGTRPNLPYLVVERGPVEMFANAGKIVYTELETTNAEGVTEIKATPNVPTMWTLLVTGYGGDAETYLNKIQLAKHLAQLQESMLPVLRIHSLGVLNSIPEFVDNRWENRVQMNVDLIGVSAIGGTIDTVDTHGFDFTTTR